MHDPCSDALTLLDRYLDGELDESHRNVLEQHLRDCAPCLEAYDFEAELRAVIRQRCCSAVPPGLRDKIRAALREGGHGPTV